MPSLKIEDLENPSELVHFVCARVQEDRAIAEVAVTDQVASRRVGADWTAELGTVYGSRRAVVREPTSFEGGLPVPDGIGVAEHIARFDPAFALALLDTIDWVAFHYPAQIAQDRQAGKEQPTRASLAALSLVHVCAQLWDEHDDFDPRWRR